MTDQNALAVSPYLLVADIHRSVKWYTEKLGFRSEKIWGVPPVFTIAQLDGVSIMLKQSKDAPTVVATSSDDRWNAYVWVRDLEAIKRRLAEHGVPLRRGPEKTNYNCEEIEVEDPDGHVLCFGRCW